jgi:hypothetical protein
VSRGSGDIRQNFIEYETSKWKILEGPLEEVSRRMQMGVDQAGTSKTGAAEISLNGYDSSGNT